MKTELSKWGNSLALRAPSAFAKEIGADEGKELDMTVEGGALVVRIAEPKKRRYRLEDLVGAITEGNRHAEIEWGGPVGDEAW